jgi:predicted nucleic acid-binding protein
MTVLVDTGVVYADHDTDATRHDVAKTLCHFEYLKAANERGEINRESLR